ncbi:Oxysterol binding protein [Ceratobasidium sp. 395]|nr:Oxysterol binding protein [Ceratobasidium sp. 395]
MSAPADAGAAVPQAQKGTWTSFVKSLASFSGDLSSMTAPPFILSPVSLTEFPGKSGGNCFRAMLMRVFDSVLE